MDWSGVSISTTLRAPKGQLKKKEVLFNQTAKINRAQIFLIAGCLINSYRFDPRGDRIRTLGSKAVP